MGYHIPVLIEQDEDGVFIVSAPTLRGCHSYGDTYDRFLTRLLRQARLDRITLGGIWS